MAKRNFKLLHNAGAVVLGLLTMLLIFSPEFSPLKSVSQYTVYFMLGLVGLGLAFLTISYKRLMFASFACAGLLCLFLKKASNTHIVLPEVNNLPSLQVAHINLANFTNDYDQLLPLISDLDLDVVSFQEYTPDWNFTIGNMLDSMFLHQQKNVRLDPFGMAVFSQHQMIETETFQYNAIPNLKVDISFAGEVVSLVCSYVLPPFGKDVTTSTKEHLDVISSVIKGISNPVFSIGDFNMVYHANEVTQFRANTLLQNSRREIPVGTLKMPYDHIFYSTDLECTNFSEITDLNQSHIGIRGTFQIKSKQGNLEKPSSLSSLIRED